MTVVEGGWYYLRTYRGARDSKTLALNREIRNLLSSLTLLWPLPGIFVATNPLQAPFRVIVRLLRWFNSSGDLDKFSLLNLASAHPEQEKESFKRGEERFDWLGQRARLINIYRIYALRQMLTVRKEWKVEQLRECFERVYRSAQWAALINDPCRFGKSWLVLLEVNRVFQNQFPEEWELVELRVAARLLMEWGIARKEIEAIEYQYHLEWVAARRTTSMHLFDLQLSDEVSVVAPNAWAQIRCGEIGSLYIATAITLYRWGQKRKNRRGLLLRLLAFSLLETS
jgi:hypothetical protein